MIEVKRWRLTLLSSIGLALGLTGHDIAAAQPLPPHLSVFPQQCPPSIREDQPRNEFLHAPEPRPGADPPPRLLDEVTFVVAGQSYVAPIGIFYRTDYDERWTRRIFSEDGKFGTLPPFSFWMPSGRPVERYPRPGSHRFCESGRPPPPLDHYVVSVQAHLPGSTTIDDARETRRRWRVQIEEILGAPMEDVLAGRFPSLRDQIVRDVPGAVSNRPIPENKLQPDSIFVLSDGLFGQIRCTATSAAAELGEPGAMYRSCRAHIGPADLSSPQADVEFAIPYDRIGDWPKLYADVLNLLATWTR